MAQFIGNRFELYEEIGAGGMGTVSRGIDLQTGDAVAIKQLRAEVIAKNPDLIQRFVREGEILRTLNHPNIVKMVAMVDDGGQQYLVMDYISGGSLAEPSEPRTFIFTGITFTQGETAEAQISVELAPRPVAKIGTGMSDKNISAIPGRKRPRKITVKISSRLSTRDLTLKNTFLV